MYIVQICLSYIIQILALINNIIIIIGRHVTVAFYRPEFVWSVPTWRLCHRSTLLSRYRIENLDETWSARDIYKWIFNDYKFLTENFEGERAIGRRRHIYKDNIEMDIKKIVCEWMSGVNWTVSG